MEAEEARRLVESNQAHLAESCDWLEAELAEWQQHGRTGRLVVELQLERGRVRKARRCSDENS